MSFNSLDSILGEAQKGLVTGNVSKNINITDIIDTPDARTEIEDDNHTIAELAQSILVVSIPFHSIPLHSV